MLIATMFIPAYTFEPKDVLVKREKHQRYTMKDIGKLEDRLDNVEYYTALSLLERNAESFEITDANGLNRFKSGFMVDNFKGHRVGDTAHRDYKCSMDMERGEVRPMFNQDAVALEEVDGDGSAILAADRTAANYTKTGDYFNTHKTKDDFYSNQQTILMEPLFRKEKDHQQQRHF